MNYIAIPGLKYRPPAYQIRFDKHQIKGENILKTVAEHFGFTPSDLIKMNRKKEIVHARRFVMYFLKQYTQLTLLQIGQLLGDRDHTTIIHNINSMKDLLEVYPEMQRELLIIDNKL